MTHDHLTNLRALLHNDPGPDAWTTLLNLLTEADHPDADLRHDYAAHLLDQRWPDHLRALTPALRHLSLRYSALGPAGAEHLARWPGLAHLTSLDLGSCELGDEGLRALLASPHLNSLRTLHLDANHLGPRAAEAIAASPHLADLRTLSLATNQLGSNEARTLASSPHLTHLQRLDLAHNHRIRAAATRALADSLPALSLLRVRPEAAPTPHVLHHDNPHLRLLTATTRWDDPFDAARHNPEGAS